MSDQREESPCAASPGSEEGFRKLVDAGLVGMAIGRPDKGLVSFNQPFCDMLGYTLEELKEKGWDELTHPDDLAEDQQRFEAMLAGDTEGRRICLRPDLGHLPPSSGRIGKGDLRHHPGHLRAEAAGTGAAGKPAAAPGDAGGPGHSP
jgi:PAS domain-containing protein